MAQGMFDLIQARIWMMLDEDWLSMTRAGYKDWPRATEFAVESGYVPFGEDSP